MNLRMPSPPTVSQVHLWSLREDMYVEADGTTDSVVLHTRWGDIRVWRPGRTVREALRRMSLGPISLENVVDGLPEEPGSGPSGAGRRRVELARLQVLLDSLSSVVVRSLALEDAQQPLLSVIPMAPEASFRPRPVPDGAPVRLSRFAVMRTDGDTLVLESPLSLHRVVFPRPEGAWVVSALGRGTTAKAVAETLPLQLPVIEDVLSHLGAAGMLVVGEPGAGEGDHRFPEDTDPALATWSHHELLFHSRSRLGRHDGDFGATYRHVGSIRPEPAVKPLPPGTGLRLHRPDLTSTAAADPPLTTVIESRRSVRGYGRRPLNARQLGELLYRVARVRSTSTAGAARNAHEISDRPYPSVGAAYELEFYLTVGDCAGIPRGVHYYDPGGHSLIMVNDADHAVREMLDGARIAADTAAPPPVLITITARFRRLSWQYSGLPYSLALKHVGVVQQTLYLVATAMGLAPCALASGDSELAARVIGLDWRVESSVGEFVIGPPPETSPDTGDNTGTTPARVPRSGTAARTMAGVPLQPLGDV